MRELQEAPALGAAADDAGYALSASQLPFFLLAQLHPDSACGNGALLLRLRGELDEAALEASLRVLYEHHENWRTSASVCAGRAVARVHPFEARFIERIDRSGAPLSEQELEHLLHERVRRPFKLGEPPWLRVHWLKLGPRAHVLLFVAHHVGFDGYSLYKLLPGQLASLYAARRSGGSSELPQSAPYRAFALLQRAESGMHAEFWREYLAGVETSLDLPTDWPRSPRRSLEGAQTHRWLDAAALERVEAGARALSVSVSDVLLAAFAAQLARYSEQLDFLIGVPNANRREPRFAESFGCLMQTPVVRANLLGDPSLGELAQRMREAKRRAFKHLDPALDELLRELDPQSAAGRNPGYQAVFNYMDFSPRDARLEGIEVEGERPDHGWTALDLSLDAFLDAGGLRFTLEYDSALFTAETASRMLGHYEKLVSALVREPSQRLSEVDFLQDDERDSLLRAAQGVALDYPRSACLHDLLRERLWQTKDAIAVLGPDYELGYAELFARVSALASQLRNAGVRPGRFALLFLKDPLASLVAMLATLEAGGAYIPVDATLPPERLAFTLEDSAPSVIVTETALRALLPESPAARLCVDELPASRESAPVDRAAPRATPDDPAYVIFTSGSTGRPKGVVVRHRNIVHQLFARYEVYGQPPARMLVLHSLAFDSAVAGIYWALSTGGTLVLPGGDARRDPGSIKRTIERLSITHVDIVPSLYAELLGKVADGDLQSLRVVIVGGEALSAALAARHLQRLPHARLFNEYGPTETTVFSTVYEVRADRGVDNPLPIGRPIANTRCYVLDSARRLVPVGAPGELYIGGDGVAQGYLGRPELSAQRFLPDPFSQEPEARMYRTGDRVRLRADSQIEFLGRADRQVKVRGYRVELGEIEEALLRLPNVLRAAAVPRNQGQPNARIDAYVVGPEDQPLSISKLRSALRSTLPQYMMPASISEVATIPLTAAGKVDLKRLPEPQSEMARPSFPAAVYVEPRSERERVLCEVWRELLGVPRIGVHDDFFVLGGHSLLAVRMLSTVETKLGVYAPLSAFSRTPTPEGLALLLERAESSTEETLLVPIQDGDARPPLWLIHPVGGHALYGRRIATYMSPLQPVLGIQSRGLTGQHEPLATIEAMADLYLGIVRAEQPRGPYLLAGSSMGGLVALELARRVLAYEALEQSGARGALVEAIARVTRANERANDTYKASPYPGRIVLLRASDVPIWPGHRFDDTSNGWTSIARDGVESIAIAGSHRNMLDEPVVAEVASALQRAIDRALSGVE